MNTSITKSRLKELVKEVMVEENEYQAFFQKALDKAGKDINAMSDEEKKAFFNKIDSAWNGKGEKNEQLTGGQNELDVDKDGDIEGDDLANLRASKEESISTELPNATIPAAIKMKLSQAIDKIKDAKLNPMQKLQLVAQVVDSLGVDKSQLGTIANKIRSKMESKMNELEFNSKEEMDAYKKAHNVRPGTELKLAPITKRVGHAIAKGAEKVGDKVMNTVGKALYTTKVGNAAMKGIGHASNAVTKKMGLDNMNDKESDAEVDAWKDYYKKK
jgi:BMFP domain-containing protein YqiC